MARTFSKRDAQLRGKPRAQREDRPQRVKERAPIQRRPDGQFITDEALRRLRDQAPEEALRLAEDIAALTLAQKLVGSIDPLNIMTTITQGERDTARELQRNLLSSLRNWQRYATVKLATEHLAP